MPKCDTPKTNKDLLFDDGARGGWCRACYREMLGDDSVGVRCRECEVIHLQRRTIPKLEGSLCITCAKEYEKNLLDKMTRKEETTCSGS